MSKTKPIIISLSILIVAFLMSSCKTRELNPNILQTGDLLFRSTLTSRDMDIEKLTRSRCSSVGLVYRDGPKIFIYEAADIVKPTPINEWLKNGDYALLVVKRLKNAAQVFTDSSEKKLQNYGMTMIHKPYDYELGWDENRFYSAELVWKMYKNGLGIELCKPRKMGELDMTDEFLRNSMLNNYKNNIPKNQSVVVPVDILQSDLLETIWFR
jgi:hypothetical protein